MSEENQNNSQEKTEQPTQRRIEKAKEEGKLLLQRKCMFYLLL